MTSTPAHVRPDVLRWARESIGYELEEAANKLRVSLAKLQRAEQGSDLLTMRQAERAATVYERPLAALFAEEPPTEEPQEAQFRRLPGVPAPPWPPQVVSLVRRVRERQDAALTLYEALGENPVWPEASRSLDVPLGEAASRVREVLGISLEEQAGWRDSQGYEPLRNWIDATEGLGVLVMQDGSLKVEEMRGFASLHDAVPAIVVNTNDDPRARAYTVIHELGHLYLASQRALIDDLAQLEAWCDEFAGEVLLPRGQLTKVLRAHSFVSDLLQKFDLVALIFGVTPRATVVRARRIGLLSQDETNETLNRISARGPRSGASGGDYYRTQLSRLGPAYSRLVFAALEDQAVTYAFASGLLGMKVDNFDTFRRHLEQRAEPA